MKEIIWVFRRMGRSFMSLQWACRLRKDFAAWLRFWKAYRMYRDMAPEELRPPVACLYPCIGEDVATTPIEPVYFYQDSWAFERIARLRPDSHVDVGSHHVFVAHLSKIIPTTMVDIRPLSLNMPSIRFKEGTILNLPFEDESIGSLSSLCVVEHIGLGRYGDPLDPFGSEKAFSELRRVLAPGGHLFFSVPVDDDNITYFNAHRAFTQETLLSWFGSLVVEDEKYICGSELLSIKAPGYCTGLYHLRKS